MGRPAKRKQPAIRTCRVCGCTDVTPCINGYGEPCSWIESDLCSACADLGSESTVSGPPPESEGMLPLDLVPLPWWVTESGVVLATEGDLRQYLRARAAGGGE
jgi:hypothetical protein